MNHEWINEAWNGIVKKLSQTVKHTECDYPYTVKDGEFYNNHSTEWWTNGFWVGILWRMYAETNCEVYKERARELEEKLDEVLHNINLIDHDAGFIWLQSAVADYKLTKDQAARNRGLIAASYLSSRYKRIGQYIRAWNSEDCSNAAIIDCMMNIPILYWASNETGDERFKQIAISHADTALKTFIRSDGSVNHINLYDPITGEYIGTRGGQGYCDGSSWTRGQAWAIYGFTISYMYTGKEEYLNAAKSVAHYFTAALSSEDDFVPMCDFRAPRDAGYRDTTAGVIAACGMIEIAKCVSQYEKNLYLNTALKILKAIYDNYTDFTDQSAMIVSHGTEAWSVNQNIPIIYGDYYFIEAIVKLREIMKQQM